MASSVQVTAGVISRVATILVCQRPAGGYHPGKWEFPGGKAEPGESLEVCMQRELSEELGIDAVVGRILWRTQHEYPGRGPFTLTFFHIPRYSGQMTNRSFAAVRWTPVTDVGTLDFLEGDREFVDALSRGEVRLD